jgi:hypothetical protein
MKAGNHFDTPNGTPTPDMGSATDPRHDGSGHAPRRRRRPRSGSVETRFCSTPSIDGRRFVRTATDDLDRFIDAVERARSVMNRRTAHGLADWRR